MSLVTLSLAVAPVPYSEFEGMKIHRFSKRKKYHVVQHEKKTHGHEHVISTACRCM